MNRTNIGWADYVWNPVTGCTKISPGCKNCYAEALAGRLQKMGQARYARGFEVRMHHDWVNGPSKVKKPQRVFVCSMSDLFHEAVTDEFIDAVFRQMAEAPQHTFMVLTKRPTRMREFIEARSVLIGGDSQARWVSDQLVDSVAEMPVYPLPNVWLGVSVEDQERADERIPRLLDTPAALRFLSVEPMLETLHLRPWLDMLDWVICGAESGPGRRPFDRHWARQLLRQCRLTQTPFFFKQGSAYKPAQDDILDGEILHDFPSPASAR